VPAALATGPIVGGLQRWVLRQPGRQTRWWVLASTIGALFPLAAVERIFLGGYPRTDEFAVLLFWQAGNLIWGGAAYGVITGLALVRLLRIGRRSDRASSLAI
jgi:hypothetical protein